MKRLYIGGALLSAVAHAPLLKDEEYAGFALSTLLWPIPLAIWCSYLHYAMWNSYAHRRKFPENSS